jgi:uncharacterized protein (TIGR03118 family)
VFDLDTHGVTRRTALRTRRVKGRPPQRARPRIEALEARLVLSGSGHNLYLQTNLVSDIQGAAEQFDPNLKNPWGVSFSTGSPFWVSDQASNVNGSDVATLYNVDGTTGAVGVIPVSFDIPNQGGAAPDAAINGPTGQVNTKAPGITTNKTDFPLNGKEAAFIFANMDGSISAWNGGPTATIKATVPGASFTGLAIANDKTGAAFLYAADQNSENIDVFNSQWTMTAQLTDPNGLPSGFNSFNVQNLNGLLYVTYTNQNIPSGGIVDVFKPDGTFVNRLIDDPAGNWLDNPWGLAIAPAGFGKFGGDLLVGNNGGNFWINAFDPVHGDFKGTLTLASGAPFSENNLWALTFGNGASGGVANTLYFTAGIGGTDGLIGSLQAIPSLSPEAPIVTNLPQAAFQTLSTIPANGDLNPYGVAFVPETFPSGGSLHPGDILVSNFNSAATNQNGTGTTIVDIAPDGTKTLFYQGPSTPDQIGLDTALGVLKSGFVIVGNLPATYDSQGNILSVGPGSLRILDRTGTVVETLSDSNLLDGPWDMTINDQGDRAQIFVSNVLSGTVTRIDLEIHNGANPKVTSETQIASGYAHEVTQPVLAFGPTGLAYDPKRDILYVASTLDNEIFAISDAGDRRHDAGMGRLIFNDNTHLHGPLGLVLAPNGDLIVANGDGVNPDPSQPSELVEFTPHGHFVGQFSINSNPAAPFGVAVTDAGGLLRLAAVDDDTNSLDIWTFHTNDDDDSSDSRGDFPFHGSLAARTNLMSAADGSLSLGAIPAGPLALPGSPASKSRWRSLA